MVMTHFPNEHGGAERLPAQSPLSGTTGSDESIRLAARCLDLTVLRCFAGFRF